MVTMARGQCVVLLALACVPTWEAAYDFPGGSVGCHRDDADRAFIQVPATGLQTRRNLNFGGVKREFYIAIPSDYNEEQRPHPLVFLFHPFHDWAGHMARFKDFSQRADEASAIMVYPQGLADAPQSLTEGAWEYEWASWNASGSVGSPGPEGPTCEGDGAKFCYESCQALPGGCRDKCWFTTCADDLGFITQLLNELEGEMCVDTSEIHAVGESNGGQMVLTLASDPHFGPRLSSVAVVGAVPFAGFLKPLQMRPIRFMGIYGWYDEVMTAFPNVEGRHDMALAKNGWRLCSWENATSTWAKDAGCSGELQHQGAKPAGAAACYRQQDCSGAGAATTDIHVCIWDGVHEWPEFATGAIWQFIFPGGIPSKGLKIWHMVLAILFACSACVCWRVRDRRDNRGSALDTSREQIQREPQGQDELKQLS